MKLNRAVAVGLFMGAAMMACAPATMLAQGPPSPPPGYQGPPPPGYAPQPWEMPPAEYQEVARRGYHDGVEGARKDWGNHRRPDVENRDEYRHPRFHGPDGEVYRDAFRRGYQAGVEHLWNAGPR